MIYPYFLHICTTGNQKLHMSPINLAALPACEKSKHHIVEEMGLQALALGRFRLEGWPLGSTYSMLSMCRIVYVYMCIYIYIYIYTHVYVYIFIYVYIYPSEHNFPSYKPPFLGDFPLEGHLLLDISPFLWISSSWIHYGYYG